MKPTYAVSGFPRSGTSTMMRFLHYGGVPVLVSDHKREGTSEFNPYGEWELEDVGHVLAATSPKETAGKVVKVVAPYIQCLPLDRLWKVVFMNRDINEIITSLMAMRTVWEYKPAEAIRDAKIFLGVIGVPILDVWYKDMMKYPKSTAMAISDFLGVELNAEKAAQAVDPNARKRIQGVRYTKGDEPLLGFDFNRIVSESELEL